jgi:iron(III) transport system substrate-binding protein
MIMRQSPDGSNPQPGYDWLKKLDANTGAYAANPADLYLKLSRQQGTLSAWTEFLHAYCLLADYAFDIW